jgi:hypothetical protein
MKIARFTPQILLLAMLVWVAGCVTPDPLAGWKPDFSPPPIDPAIEKDCHDYIQTLSPRKSGFVISVNFFEDGMGQHAVEIQMGVNGSVWRHVLIYDKENKRIKVIKYKTGGYRS